MQVRNKEIIVISMVFLCWDESFNAGFHAAVNLRGIILNKMIKDFLRKDGAKEVTE